MKPLTEVVGIPLTYREQGILHTSYTVLASNESPVAVAQKFSFFRWRWRFETTDTLLEMKGSRAYNVKPGDFLAKIDILASVGTFGKLLLNRRVIVQDIAFPDGKRFRIVQDRPVSGGKYSVIDERDTVTAELNDSERSVRLFRDAGSAIESSTLLMALVSALALSNG